MTAPFSHYLPYWTSREVTVGKTDVAVLVLVDGTIALGFEVSGTDLFSADNEALNRQADSFRRALNYLDSNAYLQADWTTDGDWTDVIDAYSKRGAGAHPVLERQRIERTKQLKQDKQLRRGRLIYWFGLRKALPVSSGQVSTGLVGQLKSLFGAKGSELTEQLFEKQVVALSAMAERVLQELGVSGMQFKPLSEQALLREAFCAINPVSGSLKKTGSLEFSEHPDEVEASDHQDDWTFLKPRTLREQLPLGDMKWEETFFQLDDPPLLHRALSLQRLPNQTSPDLPIGTQFATSLPFRLVTTFTATDNQAINEKLTRKRNRIQSEAGGGITRNVNADIALDEYETVLERILTHDQKVFRSNITAIVSGHSHDELDAATSEVKEAFSSLGAFMTTESARQLPSYVGSLPANGYQAPMQHTLLTSNAADLLPWFSPSPGDKNAQVIYHTRQQTLRSLSFDNDKVNKNGLVIGSSGSGKSFLLSSLFEPACLAEGGPVIIVDVQGAEVSNYKILADIFGGQYTPLASTADIAFNPFFPHEEIIVERTSSSGEKKQTIDSEKIGYLKQIVALMAMPHVADHPQKALLYEISRAAVLKAYRATKNKGRPPLLKDVVAQLEEFESPRPEYAPLAREMFLGLETRIKDPTWSRLLNRPSNFAGKSNFLVFDFFGLEKDPELATILLLSVSFYIWSHIQKLPREVIKFILFDETWKLLSHPVAAEIVAELYRTGRKWGASTFAITQDLNDFTSSPIAPALMQNANSVFLMMHATDHQRVAELFDLGPRQLELFKSLKFKGGEYSELLYLDRQASEATVLQVRPTAYDLWLNTTNAADVGFRTNLAKKMNMPLHEAIAYAAEHYPSGAPKAEQGGHDAQ